MQAKASLNRHCARRAQVFASWQPRHSATSAPQPQHSAQPLARRSACSFLGQGVCAQRRHPQQRARQRTHVKSMINVDFASPSLVLGAVLIGCGIVLLQLRQMQRRISRDGDIVVAAMVSIVGSTLIFQGWRLDPLLLLSQALTTSIAFWYGLEAFKLRSERMEEEELLLRGQDRTGLLEPPTFSDRVDAFSDRQDLARPPAGQQPYLPPSQDQQYPWGQAGYSQGQPQGAAWGPGEQDTRGGGPPPQTDPYRGGYEGECSGGYYEGSGYGQQSYAEDGAGYDPGLIRYDYNGNPIEGYGRGEGRAPGAGPAGTPYGAPGGPPPEYGSQQYGGQYGGQYGAQEQPGGWQGQVNGDQGQGVQGYGAGAPGQGQGPIAGGKGGMRREVVELVDDWE